MNSPQLTGTPASGPTLKLREDFSRGVVVLFANDVPVKSDPEYRTVAIYAQTNYGLSDKELVALYQDYRDNYDQA